MREMFVISVCEAVDIRFVPLAKETFGGWSDMAPHQISLSANRQAHWSTPRVVPERPIPCSLCCHTEEHRSGHYRLG
jgi:hypothetical protein